MRLTKASAEVAVPSGCYRAKYLGGEKQGDDYRMEFEIVEFVERAIVQPTPHKEKRVFWTVPVSECFRVFSESLAGSSVEETQEIDDERFKGAEYSVDVGQLEGASVVTGATRWSLVAKQFERMIPEGFVPA